MNENPSAERLALGRTCTRCGKTFSLPSVLRKHQARKTPCDPVLEADQDVLEKARKPYACSHCGRRFTTAPARCRHQKEACRAATPALLEQALGPLRKEIEALRGGDVPQHGTQNIQNNITVFAPVTNNLVATTNVLAIGSNNIGVPGAPPGWPPGWAAPLAPPTPFPSSFTIPLDVLRRALPSDAKKADACRRGDPTAIAHLMVGIVQQMHSNPRERNMYLNPKRADQVLVYIPERWEVRPLLEAVDLVFEQVAGEIEEALPHVEQPLLGIARAAREGFHGHREEVVRRSRGAMAAHLANMASLARGGDSGECWLGDAGADVKGTRRELGKESSKHLTHATLIDNLERSLGVYSLADVQAEPIADLAVKALITFAHLLLNGRPDNLTVAVLEGGIVHYWEHHTWKAGHAAEKGRHQADAMVGTLLLWLGGCTASATHLTPLVEYLKAHREEMATAEGEKQVILAQYAKAALRHHGEAWVREIVSKRTTPPRLVQFPATRYFPPVPAVETAPEDLDALLASLLK